AIAPNALEVRLPYPDVSIVPSFVEARRRVYMTATLADDTILQTQLGVPDTCVTRPIAPASASDVGDRIILTPVETSQEVSWEDVKAAAVAWARDVNVVVIVPSVARSASWADVTSEIHDKDSIVDCVGRLNSGDHLGVVVLIARYDGVD